MIYANDTFFFFFLDTRIPVHLESNNTTSKYAGPSTLVV